MTEIDRITDRESLDLLLAYVVDTCEKLDVVLCLHHATPGVGLTTLEVATHLKLPWGQTAEHIGELHRSGVLATVHQDGAGWWIDEHSGWIDSIEIVVRVCARDRRLLLRRMARLALLRLRAGERGAAELLLRRKSEG